MAILLSPSLSRRRTWFLHRRPSPSIIRLFFHLFGCIGCTFGLGSVFALRVAPAIVRDLATGSLIGPFELFLVALWVVSLLQMWEHVWRDLFRLRLERSAQEVPPDEALAQRSPEI